MPGPGAAGRIRYIHKFQLAHRDLPACTVIILGA
jgi:hypothetical protein